MNIGRHVAWRSLRTAGWAYHHRYQDGTESLYDLRADPGELDDRAAAESERLARLRELEAAIERWEEEEVGRVEALPRGAR